MMTHLPKKDQQTIMTVANAPRFEGERNPIKANTMEAELALNSGFESLNDMPKVTPAMAQSCAPFPTRIDRIIMYLGERNTSP